MTTAGVLWPTKDEYDLAIGRWTETIWDEDIRSGTLARDAVGICRFGGANLYVSIYKIGDWLVRCFCSQPSHSTPLDIRERYIAIDRFCRSNAHRVSALVPVIYLEHGISIGGRILPIVKMPFLTSCPPLGEFIMDHYQEHSVMQQLSEAWLRMIHELEDAPMAHGDLDLTNVLVEQRGSYLVLKLIDYDNVWIPELTGHHQTEYGHTHFQHPHFLPPHQRPYNAQMDRFAALVIFISLKTLISYPALYDEWGADEDDRLLLSESDYQNAGLFDSKIKQLRGLSSQAMQPYLDELDASLRQRRMPRSLNELTYATQVIYRPDFLEPMPPQKAASVQAPPISDWRQVVYHTNTSLPSPTSQPPSPSKDRGKIPPLAPAVSRAPADAGNPSTYSWYGQDTYQPWHGTVIPQPPVSLWPSSPSMVLASNNENEAPPSSRKARGPRSKKKALLLAVIYFLIFIIFFVTIVLIALLFQNYHSSSIIPSILLITQGGIYVSTII